jgi:hypothetical protein
MKYFTHNDHLFYRGQDGPVLIIEPGYISIDDTQYPGGTERPCIVEVKHPPTCAGFRMAWSVARRLIKSHAARPALIYPRELLWLEISTEGPPVQLRTKTHTFGFSTHTLTF